MEQDAKQKRKGKLGLGTLEVLGILIFIGVVIVGLLPQLDLHIARQRTRDKKAELLDAQTRLRRLSAETASAEIEFDSMAKRLQEQSTLVERAKAGHATEEELRKEALAARIIEENKQRTLSQTNSLLMLETSKMRQEIVDSQAQASNMQARTNALSVALQGLETRAARLRQESLEAVQQRDQLTQDLATLRTDKAKMEAETIQADAERHKAQLGLSAVKAQAEQEAQRLTALNAEQASIQQTKLTAEAELSASVKRLDENRKALAQEQAALKTVKDQADQARGEAVTYQGQADLAKKAFEALMQEQKELQRKIETDKAAAIQQQAALTRAQTDLAAINTQIKQATETERTAREAETRSRIGEAAAQQRLEEARREEVALRKTIEQVKGNLAELQKSIQITNTPKPQP